jgi:hypothetical protein
MFERRNGLKTDGRVDTLLAMGDAAEKLYDEMIKLPPHERRALALRVLASVASDGANAAGTLSSGVASWETIESLRDVVRLGGNAVDDCNRLYDE